MLEFFLHTTAFKQQMWQCPTEALKITAIRKLPAKSSYEIQLHDVIFYALKNPNFPKSVQWELFQLWKIIECLH